MHTAGELVRVMGALRDALVVLARLESLGSLGERGLAEQSRRAAAAVLRIEEAASLDDYLRESHGVRRREVVWPTAVLGEVRALAGAQTVDLDRLLLLIARCGGQAAAALRKARSIAQTSPLLAPALLRLGAIQPILKQERTPAKEDLPAPTPSRGAGVRQKLRGPRSVPLDPRFLPSFSLLCAGVDPTMSGDDLDRAPHYWCLAAREAMASELCALNVVEYDGLPLAFYRDFAKQQWDELRHAEFFLSVGLELLPEFIAAAPREHPLRAAACAHLDIASGLPIPLEGNLYELARDATLTQRLVLMHHDTEAPGVGGFLRQARSPWGRAHPHVADALNTTVDDEAAHARIGRRWLKHLLPTSGMRAREIDEARTLRGFLLLNVMAEKNHLPLGALLAGELVEGLPQPLRGALVGFATTS